MAEKKKDQSPRKDDLPATQPRRMPAQPRQMPQGLDELDLEGQIIAPENGGERQGVPDAREDHTPHSVEDLDPRVTPENEKERQP